MTTIGKVAYIATWDASQLVKGVMTSRQVFAAQRKIVESMRSPLDRYSLGMDNLKKVIEKYPDVAKHQLQLEKQLEHQYLNEAKAIGNLTAAEAKRLRSLGSMTAAGGGKSAGMSSADVNRSRGLSEQSRVQRLTSQVEQEAAIGRRALQERLRLFKAEKAAEEKRTRDQQVQFDRQLAAARSAMKQRDQMRREDLARSMKYHSDDKAWMTAGGGGGGGMGAGAGMAARGGVLGPAALAVGALAAARSASQLAAAGVDLNRDIERTTASLNVFTGSLANSADMMEKMRSLSAETGVSFTGYTQGARTMMQFGVAAEDVVPKLREMAIITGGDAERMQSLSLAFAQTTAAGKLMGQEVLQMVNAGWSPFEEIGKKLGKTVPELRKEMEKGNITAQMVADAMTAATTAGGRFNGMLEQLEGTSARAADKQKAAWESATASVGQMLEPLTGLYNTLSTKIAGEVESLATRMSFNKDVIEQLSEAEQKAARQREAAAKRQERVDQVRKKQLADEKRMAQEAAEEQKIGLESALDLQVKLAGDIAGEDKMKKFEQVLSMLNEVNQQSAKADFIAGADPSKIASAYLDGAVEVEFKKLDAMEKQAKVTQDRLAAEEKMKSLAKSIDADMASKDPLATLTNRLAELAAANKLGHISDEQMDFAVDQAAEQSTGGQRSTMKVDSVRAGSQEAYQFLAGIQDRNLKVQMAEAKKQSNLQSVMADALKRAEAHLAQIADIKIGSDG